MRTEEAKNKNQRVKIYMILSFLGAAIGYFIAVIAPFGQWVFELLVIGALTTGTYMLSRFILPTYTYELEGSTLRIFRTQNKQIKMLFSTDAKSITKVDKNGSMLNEKKAVRLNFCPTLSPKEYYAIKVETEKDNISVIKAEFSDGFAALLKKKAGIK